MQAQWFCAAGVLAIKEQQQQNLPRGELQRGVGFVGKWFKRYEKHMPNEGEIVFFDRSWYTRATVEITMGYCSNKQYANFMKKVIISKY